MITRGITWVKEHKLTSLLLLVVFYFLFRMFVPNLGRNYYGLSMAPSAGITAPAMMESSSAFGDGAKDSIGLSASSIMRPPAPDLYTPTTNVVNRMVIQNSYMSLLVKDVIDIRKKIIEYSTSVGGYMVNAETSNPQDAPSATVTVRVPSAELDRSLETFRSWGIKVVSENIQGTDVTDQYVDIDARIATLEKTKATMEALLSRAEQIADLTNITREVINIQSQIDALTGSQKSLAENAKLAKVTLFLSTDEIALPYAPSETFRPDVIFKLAVRSFITHLRQVGTLVIWVAVYAVIWVPVLAIAYFINKRFNTKRTP